MATTQQVPNSGNNAFKDKEKPMAVRTANIVAARGIISLLLDFLVLKLTPLKLWQMLFGLPLGPEEWIK